MTSLKDIEDSFINGRVEHYLYREILDLIADHRLMRKTLKLYEFTSCDITGVTVYSAAAEALAKLKCGDE